MRGVYLHVRLVGVVGQRLPDAVQVHAASTSTSGVGSAGSNESVSGQAQKLRVELEVLAASGERLHGEESREVFQGDGGVVVVAVQGSVIRQGPPYIQQAGAGSGRRASASTGRRAST